jgi:kinesin family protein 3/17
MVRASYLQIYNEVISDLLKVDRSNLQIREDRRRGVFVEGLSEWAVRSPYEIYSLMQKGTNSRVTASTKLNDFSSRSHAVFIIIVEQMTTDGDSSEDSSKRIKVGKLNLVDLAGSERLSITGATGKRLEECKKINQSLSALGNVIAALIDIKGRSHIPYRDSKLTRLLEDSLGGNCKTTMMAMVSPSYMCFSETLSSLKFANRAKNVKNNARINEDLDQRALLRRYESELKTLRKALEEKNRDVMDKEVLYKLEEEKRRAEEDKAAMVKILETRSKEFVKEKEEKRKLEEKIKLMSSQMLLGGKKIEDTPQFRTALEAKQRAIHQEYKTKLQELEKERQQIEEDKAHVDRYKQLILKQRDIMIALTARLNERDETIIQLQEELDAYDRIHKEAEENLERKIARIQVLEGCLTEAGMQGPPEDEEDRLNDPQTDMLMRRYPPYAEEDPQSDAPLSLLTADEKIGELMDIIERQKVALSQCNTTTQRTQEQPNAQECITELQNEKMKLAADKEKLLNQLENNMLGLAENALKGIKEQKDQYRLYHINQDIQTLHKNITGAISMFR